MPEKEVKLVITWMLVAAVYGVALAVGSVGLRSLGDSATRMGRAAGHSG